MHSLVCEQKDGGHDAIEEMTLGIYRVDESSHILFHSMFFRLFSFCLINREKKTHYGIFFDLTKDKIKVNISCGFFEL